MTLMTDINAMIRNESTRSHRPEEKIVPKIAEKNVCVNCVLKLILIFRRSTDS